MTSISIVEDSGNNLVREKGKTGVSSEEFIKNPIFNKIRNHGKEFGRCSKKAQSFRATALHFFNRAKDGSFAGRANKLMLDIMHEDTLNPDGDRTVENGMKSADARSYFIGFEGNKLRPLVNVLKTDWKWNEITEKFPSSVSIQKTISTGRSRHSKFILQLHTLYGIIPMKNSRPLSVMKSSSADPKKQPTFP